MLPSLYIFALLATPAGYSQADTVCARLLATIGENSPAPFLFGEISGLAIDDSGRIYVADFQDPRIRHQTEMGKQVEDYISQQSGMNFGKVFDQYLRDVRIPELEYTITGATLSCRWASVVPGFDMPVEITIQRGMLPVQSARPGESVRLRTG